MEYGLYASLSAGGLFKACLRSWKSAGASECIDWSKIPRERVPAWALFPPPHRDARGDIRGGPFESFLVVA